MDTGLYVFVGQMLRDRVERRQLGTATFAPFIRPAGALAYAAG